MQEIYWHNWNSNSMAASDRPVLKWHGYLILVGKNDWDSCALLVPKKALKILGLMMSFLLWWGLQIMIHTTSLKKDIIRPSIFRIAIIRPGGKYFPFCALKPGGTSFKNWQFGEPYLLARSGQLSESHQKVQNSDFQGQFFMSKMVRIFLKLNYCS